MVGLRDGSVLSYGFVGALVGQMDEDSLSLRLESRRSLGLFVALLLQFPALLSSNRYPVQLQWIRDSSMEPMVLALSDRPWKLVVDELGIAATPVSYPRVRYCAPVRVSQMTNCFVFLADGGFQIVQLDLMKRLHVTKTTLKESPKRLLHHKESKTLLVSTVSVVGGRRQADLFVFDSTSSRLISRKSVLQDATIYALACMFGFET